MRNDAPASDLGMDDSIPRFIDAHGSRSAGPHKIAKEQSAYLADFGALKLWGVLRNPFSDGPIAHLAGVSELPLKYAKKGRTFPY